MNIRTELGGGGSETQVIHGYKPSSRLAWATRGPVFKKKKTKNKKQNAGQW
jgi:hypothetical protein